MPELRQVLLAELCASLPVPTTALWEKRVLESRIDAWKHLVQVESRPHSEHSTAPIAAPTLSLWTWLDIYLYIYKDAAAERKTSTVISISPRFAPTSVCRLLFILLFFFTLPIFMTVVRYVDFVASTL